MRKSFWRLNSYTGLVSLEKSWLRCVKKGIYKVWTGTEEVLKEQLSIFSSTTRTEVYHRKALGRVCEQEKRQYISTNQHGTLNAPNSWLGMEG